MNLEFGQLIAPVSESNPAGENLEYDPGFGELEQMATPLTERTMGESVRAAVEPDWERVAAAATDLLARTKDLRVAIHLTAAATRTQGITGWQSGLELVRGLLERYWDDAHPQLDAADDNDATARVNALMALGDPQSVLGYFRTATFVQSPRLGRYSLRELRIATGASTVSVTADGSPPPSIVDLEACCMDCAEDQLPAAAAALGEALMHARAIEAILRDRLGAAAPDLTPLFVDIEEVKKFVDAQYLRRFPEQAGAQNIGAEAAAGSEASSSAVPQPQQQQRPSGLIQTADDVIQRLDEICEYYARCEPSSPLPVLLTRARRLVGKSFVEVLKNVAPGGLGELQMLAGPDDESH
jgi:type VI secretion system protein ImpA